LTRTRLCRIAGLAIGVPATTFALLFAARPAVSTLTPALWLEDFHQLLQEMSSHYANLEWAKDQRRTDLPHLRAETEKALANASDDADARRILRGFVDAFGDGHLEIDWPTADLPTPAETHSAGLCERLGYRPRGGAGVDFTMLPQFSSLTAPRETFPAGVLRLSRGRTIGIVRIGVFTEKAYPDACNRVVQQLGMPDSASCDSDCVERIDLRAANLLTAALAERVEQLRHAGATALLVDITRNGGGSDWVEALARAVSSRQLRDARLVFIKHEHWTDRLDKALRDVEADLHDRHESGEVLRRAAATLKQAVAGSREPCDRKEVWTSGELHCSLLVTGLLFSSGVLPYAPPGSFAGFHSRTSLFRPDRYDYTESNHHLPLYVLVDGDTWSAAEYFAALLQDNKAATIIGDLTGGAGCGYTDGGIPTQLKNSKAEVRMPDCIRLRTDGSNEVNGVTPDVLVPWAHRDSPYQRVQKLFAVLQRLR